MANFFSSLSSIFKQKTLQSQTHLLNIDSLNKVKNKWENLGMDEGMGKCFEEVMKNFPNEPSWVMKNAQMVLKGDDGKVISFASGNKEWKINVSAGDYKYHVKAPSKSAYLARLRSRQQPLSIGYLKKVQKDLKKLGSLTLAEKSCFNMVFQRFSTKSLQIQNNAQIKFNFDMDGENVEYVFLSGNGDYKMNITYSNGQPQYRELHIRSGNKLESFLCSLQILDADNLREIQSELAQWDLLNDNLNSCFNHLVDKLPEYSKLIEENLQIYFSCYEQSLSVNSKSKDWEIFAQSNDGKVDFNFKLHTWNLFSKQNEGKTQELTVKTLDDTRALIRNLRGASKHVQLFNKALDIFREETSCLQKNACLVIECDQGEMVFISGKGKNRIDIFYHEEVIHCKVYRTGLAKIQMFFLRLITGKFFPTFVEIAVPIATRMLPFLL
ncbi:uncharacterized protein LOC107293288 [Protobothrops mucrosquamatus]|uniref:uncharacterized protein LOC107293288 n=1 Tax=Protobothrops mucrosquamatus TaxID=103944 RepID=UPI000775FD17|nr:uncharacterized protein LOC107293288 [Protobothrops mucrosquamatus]